MSETEVLMPEAEKRNRIEITEWRVLFEDEDTLNLHVLGADDTADVLALITDEQKDNYSGGSITWGDDEAEHSGQVVNTITILDGEILTSHDGRRFRVTIEEYLGGVPHA